MTQYIVSSGVVSRSLDLLPGDSLLVERGGTAVKTDIGRYAAAYVQDGGAARGTVVSSGGVQFVLSGGRGGNTTVEAGGFAVIEPGGHEVTTVLPGGHLVSTGVFVDGIARFHIATHPGGRPVISPGATEYVLPKGHILETQVEGTVRVFSGGTAGASLIESGGSEIVSAGGASFGDIVRSGGSVAVQSGGTAFGGQIAAGGTLTIASGGLVTATDIASGAHFVLSGGGTLSGSTVVGSGQTGLLVDNATLIGDSITGEVQFGVDILSNDTFNNGIDYIDGGTASNLVLNSADLELIDGVYADGVTINGGSDLLIGDNPFPNFAPAGATDVTVNAGGVVQVFVGHGGIGDLQMAVGATLQLTDPFEAGLSYSSLSFDYQTDVLTLFGGRPDDPMEQDNYQLFGNYTGDQFNLAAGGYDPTITLSAAPAATSTAPTTLTFAGNPSAWHVGALTVPSLTQADFGWNTQSTAHQPSPAAPAATTRLGNHLVPNMPSAHQLLLHQP